MADDMKRLVALIENQNKNLERLIKENERLRSTPFDMTNIERIKMLSDEVAELAKKFDDSFKEAHKHFSNLFKDKKNLYEDINKAMITFKKETDQYNASIENLKDRLTDLKKQKNDLIKQYGQDLTKWGAVEKKIYDDLIDDIDKVNDEISKTNKSYNERKRVLKDLQEKSLEYYRTSNEEQQALNKRIIDGTHAMDDASEKIEQRTRALRKGASEVTKGLTQIYQSATKTIEPWAKANQEAMTYARTMGMSQKTADAYLSKTVSWAAKNNIGILFNKSTDELIKMQGKYSEVLGRNVQLTNEQKMDMLAMEKFLGEDGMMDIANNLENFGLGMSDSAEFIHKTMSEATKTGIAASKLTKTIRENIKMAQNYTFKNGLEGLTNMAKKAIELKTDMSLVNGFIEKTSTVEGAITTGANLQVLGGSYAMGSDPLSMLHDSLNNVEGMFDRAVSMASGKVFYNNQTGNFEMGAMDRYMMKQAATVMGVDPSKMLDVAFRQASLDRIEGQAKTNDRIANDEDMIRLVKNLASWNNGRAVVNIDGIDKDVSDLTASDKSKLEAMQRTDSQNLQEMAINLRSMNEILGGTQKEINNEQAKSTELAATGINGLLRQGTEMLDIVAKIGAWANMIGGGAGILGGVWTTAAGVWRMGLGMRNIATGLRGGATTGGKGVVTAPRAGILGNGFTRADFKGGLRGDFVTLKNGTQFRKIGNDYFRLDGTKVTNSFQLNAAKNATPQRGWTNLGKGIGKGLKVGGTGALIGAGLSLGTDMVTGEFNRDRGASFGRAAGVAVGSIIGGLFGPWGAMIGGALGSVITTSIQNTQKENRDKLRKEISAKLSESMPAVAQLFDGENALVGNYNKRQLEKLSKALEDGTISEGELSGAILRKARANNDLIRMREQGIDVRVAMANGGYLEGKSHSEGGMPILGSNVSVEGGEFVVNKDATKIFRPFLEKINNGDYSMASREPLGNQLKVYKRNVSTDNTPNNSKVSFEPISINLSGTIKLESSGKQIDISNEILNNPQIISRLTELINKQFNILDNSAYNKGRFNQKFI